MINSSWKNRATEAFTPNYRPAPLLLERGEGVHIFDAEGNQFLDMISGIAVSALGHNHPKLVSAIVEQTKKILHTSNLYLNQPSIELAELMCASGFFDGVYFCNSGAEANEAAIKLARKYAHDRGHKDRNEIVSFLGSFHGRTFAALTATAQPKYHIGFQPLPEGFRYLPFDDVSVLEEGITERTAGVIIEPMQGEGGVRVPTPGFLKSIRDRCDEVGAVLIFDEVQVGVGRTGHVFAHQFENVEPDIMTLAKGIGAGLPLGAMVATNAVGSSLSYGSHATTYGGNPVACVAGKVVFEALNEPAFLENVAARGEQLMAGLRQINEKYECFQEVRGRGLLIGAELKPELHFDAKALVGECRERGILSHIAGLQVFRLAPPLILEESHVDTALSVFETSIDKLMNDFGPVA
ncbi:MAG: aspartate aminotransferase family protein [Myxococcota bacterium]|nr:aspartate aminotransferase family protein [Myxococcota bacterium]